LASSETILFRTRLLHSSVAIKCLLAKEVKIYIAIALVVERHLLSEKLIYLRARSWNSWL